MATAIADAEEPDERGKVFLWAKDRGIRLHLTAFLVFSVLVHGSGFYLFKVVYPPAVRVESEPDSITILDPKNPAVRAVIRRLYDRTIYLLPPSEQTEVRVGLADRPVHFSPAFRRAGMELAGPPGATVMPGLIEPLEPDPSPGRRDSETNGVRVKLSPTLVGRPLAPWSILHDYLKTAESLPLLRIEIDISPDGEVSVRGIAADMEEGEKDDLASIIESTLRFLPSSEAGTGWVEIGGEVGPE